MEGLIVAGFIMLNFLFVFFLIFGIKAYYKKKYDESKQKFSDAEVFKLMSRANHFLTDEQLAAISPLSKGEAKNRLMHLSMEGVLRRYNDGGVRSVYQLKEELPVSDKLPTSIHGLSDQQIVNVILEYSDDYQITIAELVIIFGIDIYEAKNILKRLQKSGLVKRFWSTMQRVYVIKQPLSQAEPKLKIPNLNTNLKSYAKSVERIKIPDADVINLAIEHKGKLTPALLCIKLKIPMQEAKMKLEELYDQGAFVLDASTDNAVLEYHLRDKNLLD